MTESKAMHTKEEIERMDRKERKRRKGKEKEDNCPLIPADTLTSHAACTCDLCPVSLLELLSELHNEFYLNSLNSFGYLKERELE